MSIMRTKSVEQAIRDTEEPEFRLEKALGPGQLTIMGIGVLIGTGIFVLAGQSAGGSMTHLFYIAADGILILLLIALAVTAARALLPADR